MVAFFFRRNLVVICNYFGNITFRVCSWLSVSLEVGQFIRELLYQQLSGGAYQRGCQPKDAYISDCQACLRRSCAQISVFCYVYYVAQEALKVVSFAISVGWERSSSLFIWLKLLPILRSSFLPIFGEQFFWLLKLLFRNFFTGKYQISPGSWSSGALKSCALDPSTRDKVKLNQLTLYNRGLNYQTRMRRKCQLLTSLMTSLILDRPQGAFDFLSLRIGSMYTGLLAVLSFLPQLAPALFFCSRSWVLQCFDGLAFIFFLCWGHDNYRSSRASALCATSSKEPY